MIQMPKEYEGIRIHVGYQIQIY
mgnify:CR=1